MKIKKVNRKQFEEMYRTLTVREMSARLGISTTTIYKIINDMGISKKGKKESWRKIIVEE